MHESPQPVHGTRTRRRPPPGGGHRPPWRRGNPLTVQQRIGKTGIRYLTPDRRNPRSAISLRPRPASERRHAI
ncbi:MAG: hypothetical protein M3434_08070, partial [Gemmatimonadota bacterium]|nr:hypothetical protein [Gemmatimonadota bacterium]